MGILEEASSFLGIALELHKGDEVTFSNFGDVRKMLQPDFFENITKDKATFIGVDGNYKLYYDPINKLTYLENRSVNYPDGLWVCGSSFGHPQAGRVTVGAWTFNLPSDAFQCVKVADNIFETTLIWLKISSLNSTNNVLGEVNWLVLLSIRNLLIYWVRDGITVIRQQVALVADILPVIL